MFEVLQQNSAGRFVPIKKGTYKHKMLKEFVSKFPPLKNMNKNSLASLLDVGNQSESSDSTTVSGFSLSKIFNPKSVFCGAPSIDAVAYYVEMISDALSDLPMPGDPKAITTTKFLMCAWRLFRHFQYSSTLSIAHRKDLVDIDFGSSKQILFNLVKVAGTPDEVFKTKNNVQAYPYYIYRYPIKDGYTYWITPRESSTVIRVLATNNITKDDILDFIWSSLGTVIQLETESEDGPGLSYVPGELAQKKIFGSSNGLISRLKSDFEYFRKTKVSRGYLLIGRPGTGKTGIVNAIVNSSEGRVFIISGLSGNYSIEAMGSLFIHMRPDFIVFDDCDRSDSSSETIRAILKLLETVKDKNPHTNFLFTANTFSGILQDDAVTRKGRIDQIFEVPEPNEDDRKEIFIQYAAEMNVSISPEDLNKCILSSEGMTGADIKEMCIQLQRANIDDVFSRAVEVETLKEKYKPEEDDWNGPSVNRLGNMSPTLRNGVLKKLTSILKGKTLGEPGFFEVEKGTGPIDFEGGVAIKSDPHVDILNKVASKMETENNLWHKV